MQTKLLATLCALLLVGGSAGFGQTSAKRKSPTSKFYVAEVEGFAQVNTGEKIEDLTEKSVFDAEGTVIETKPDSVNALVMSNGAGIYFAPDSKLTVTRFLQEPFQPNRTDLESEPSVSQTRTQLSRGAVGICTGKLIAGSSMIYNTPHTSINVLSQNTQKFVVQTSDESTVVTLFEGGITLRGANMAGGESLVPGQQATIVSRGLNQPPSITIGPIPGDQRESLENMVNGACQARSKVYFDTVDRLNNVDGATSELRPITVTPIKPSEVGPIVSPARL